MGDVLFRCFLRVPRAHTTESPSADGPTARGRRTRPAAARQPSRPQRRPSLGLRPVSSTEDGIPANIGEGGSGRMRVATAPNVETVARGAEGLTPQSSATAVARAVLPLWHRPLAWPSDAARPELRWTALRAPCSRPAAARATAVASARGGVAPSHRRELGDWVTPWDACSLLPLWHGSALLRRATAVASSGEGATRRNP